MPLINNYVELTLDSSAVFQDNEGQFHITRQFREPRNGRYREELRKGLTAIDRYMATYELSAERTLLQLDGQYGNGVVLSDVAGFTFVTRGKDYHLLDHPLIQARLHLPPDQLQQRPESQMERSLYDCPKVPVGPEGKLCRVVVATHPADKKKSPVGVTRKGVVYELSSRTCHNTPSPLAMSSNCTCIAAPLDRSSRMKIKRLNLTDGALTRPGGRSAGN